MNKDYVPSSFNPDQNKNYFKDLFTHNTIF